MEPLIGELSEGQWSMRNLFRVRARDLHSETYNVEHVPG